MGERGVVSSWCNLSLLCESRTGEACPISGGRRLPQLMGVLLLVPPTCDLASFVVHSLTGRISCVELHEKSGGSGMECGGEMAEVAVRINPTWVTARTTERNRPGVVEL